MQILSLTGQITRSTWEVPCPRLPKAQTRLALKERAHPQGAVDAPRRRRGPGSSPEPRVIGWKW